jgi:phospholipase/carboxylesterase
VSRWPLAAVLLLLTAAAGCGGGDDAQIQVLDVTTGDAAAEERPCGPGEHAFTLSNGRPARMRVTPGSGARALVVVLHGAGGTRASGLDAFRGGWDEPGLVLIAPASKGQTWSILRSQQDVDLESVNLALAEAYGRCTIDRGRLAVGGFSDGATYALTLGVSNGDLFPAVMALSPGGIVAGEQRGAPRFFVSHGTLDTVLPIARAGDAVVEKLRDAGYRVTYRRFRGGHEASPETSAAAVRWFLEG